MDLIKSDQNDSTMSFEIGSDADDSVPLSGIRPAYSSYIMHRAEDVWKR